MSLRSRGIVGLIMGLFLGHKGELERKNFGPATLSLGKPCRATQGWRPAVLLTLKTLRSQRDIRGLRG